MSIGAGIGGILGAVVGWWLPPFGPAGSMFWGSIGMGIGSYATKCYWTHASTPVDTSA